MDNNISYNKNTNDYQYLNPILKKLRYLSKKYLTKTFLTFLAAILLNAAYTEWGIRNSFKRWHADGKELIEAYRKIYFFCENIKNRNDLSEIERNKLWQYNDDLIKKNVDFINSYIDLGLLVDKTTYRAIHKLTCWADHISESSGNICALDLKDKNIIDAWPDKIMYQIELNTEKNKELGVMLKNLIDSFTSDPRTSVHPKTICEIDKTFIL